MAKPELGTKRLCPNCGAKYYDLNRSPILCPRCGSPFDPHMVAKARPAAAAEEDEEEREDEDDLALNPEFVPLEETEDTDGDDVPEIEDAEIEDDGEDDTFLEEDEEGDGDVSDIIGDVPDEEER